MALPAVHGLSGERTGDRAVQGLQRGDGGIALGERGVDVAVAMSEVELGEACFQKDALADERLRQEGLSGGVPSAVTVVVIAGSGLGAGLHWNERGQRENEGERAGQRDSGWVHEEHLSIELQTQFWNARAERPHPG